MRTKYKVKKLLSPNNVIAFPQDQIKYPERVGNIAAIDLNVKIAKHLSVTQTLEEIIPLVMNKLEERGFQVFQEDLIDGCLFVEALRSLLLKQVDIDHPFQRLAPKIFNTNKDGDFDFAEVKIEIKK